MASYEKIKDGKYKVRWRNPDGSDRGKTVGSAAAARKLRREVEGFEDRGEVWVDPRERHLDEADLKDMLEQYIRFHGTWTAVTVQSVRSILENGFIGWCEDDRGLSKARRTSVARLSEQHVLRWRDSLTVNAKTQKNYLGHIRRFWEWVETRDKSVDRPPRVIPPLLRADPNGRGAETAGDEDTEVVPPTWEQMDAVIGELRVEWLRRLAWVCRCQGLRVSQVLRLRWEDIDMKHGAMRLRKGRGTKRTSTRIAPIAPVLHAEMRTWLHFGPNVIGHKPDYTPNVTLRRAWKRSGVPQEVWDGHTSHAFRKGVIDGFDNMGIHPQAIADYVGHKFAEGEGALTRVAQMSYQRTRHWGRMLEAAEAVPPVGGPYPKPNWDVEMPDFQFGT